MTPRVLIAGEDVSHLALVSDYAVDRGSGESISTATVTFMQDLQGALPPAPPVNLLNSPDDLTAPAWLNSGVTVAGGFADPGGGTGAFRLTATGGDSYLAQDALEPINAGTLVFQVWLRADTPAWILLNAINGGDPDVQLPIRVETYWQKFEIRIGGAYWWARFYIGGWGSFNPPEVIYAYAPNARQILPEASSRFAPRAWSEWQPIEIQNRADAADVRFTGLITSIARRQIDNERFQVALTASDYGILLDRRVITETWTDATDRTIVKAIASLASIAWGITATDATVAFTATIPVFELKDATLREGLDYLSDLTGARWHVDTAKRLHWYKPGTAFAPFDLSDTPAPPSSEPFGMLDFERDFSGAANRITVLGGFTESGSELRTTRDDDDSIAAYGVLEAVAVDREVTSGAVAVMVADAQLAARAHPVTSGRALVRRAGLAPGQTINVKSALYGIDGPYIIHGVRERYAGKSIAYEVAWGARQPDIVTALMRLQRQDKATPVAAPAPGMVEDILAAELTTVIQTPAVSAIVAETVVGMINSGETGTISATRMQGAFNLGAVTLHAQDVTGVFISDQLADDILDSLRLVNRDMQIVERLAALPALPDPDYPDGALVLVAAKYGAFLYGQRKYGSTLYENVGGAWVATSAAAALTGTMRARDIESVYADSIIGLIISSQIQNLNVNQLVGQIQAHQIYQVLAESITAVYADRIVGQLGATQIGALNATTLTLVGQWKDSHIEAVSASKLLAGTIAATVRMTSPDIEVSAATGNYKTYLSAATGFKITSTVETRSITVDDAKVKVTGLTGNVTTIIDSIITVDHVSGGVATMRSQATESYVGVSHSTHSWLLTANSTWAELTSGGGNARIVLGGGGGTGSYISSPMYRFAHGTAVTAVPASVSKWINAYDIAGNLLGKIPVI